VTAKPRAIYAGIIFSIIAIGTGSIRHNAKTFAVSSPVKLACHKKNNIL